MNPPWNRRNSEKKPFVVGKPIRANDPMKAAVAVIGILPASPPILLMLLSPRNWSIIAPTTMKSIPLAVALLIYWNIEPEIPNDVNVASPNRMRSEEHTSELQSRFDLV